MMPRITLAAAVAEVEEKYHQSQQQANDWQCTPYYQRLKCTKHHINEVDKI